MNSGIIHVSNLEDVLEHYSVHFYSQYQLLSYCTLIFISKIMEMDLLNVL